MKMKASRKKATEISRLLLFLSSPALVFHKICTHFDPAHLFILAAVTYVPAKLTHSVCKLQPQNGEEDWSSYCNLHVRILANMEACLT